MTPDGGGVRKLRQTREPDGGRLRSCPDSPARSSAPILWIYRVHPESQILGKYSADVAHGGLLGEQLIVLAAVLGLMAVLSSIMTSSSGQGGGGYFIGLVLGLFALSYPLLTWLNILSGPLSPSFLE